MNTTTRTLIAARSLIARPDAWTKVFEARDHNNNSCRVFDDDACKYCMVGAIARASLGKRTWERDALQALRLAIGSESVPRFNDHPARTHDEVLAAFDAAIAQTQ